MPRNLEIKARIADAEGAIGVAQALQARPAGDLAQTDTYFHVPHGRLKLRETEGCPAELIHYHREEASSRRSSDFEICIVQDTACLQAILRSACGLRAVVRKRRRVFLLDSSRIHVDTVETLGAFLEFEVPVDSSEEAASRTLDYLIARFEVGEEDFIRGSYVDLLLEAAPAGA